MKFKIIASIVLFVLLIVLTVLFSPRQPQLNEDGTPIQSTDEVPFESVQ